MIGSRCKQQTAPAWNVSITLYSYAWYLLPMGIFVLSLGLYLLLGLPPIPKEVIPYTHCNSTENPGKTCAEIIQNDRYAKCTCIVFHNIKTNFPVRFIHSHVMSCHVDVGY
jgi:hypothetical protein